MHSRCFARLEAKLEQFHGNLNRAAVELAQEWRTDRALRHLEAFLLATDGKSTYLLSGTGDVIEPDDGVLAVGSGGSYALSAARALLRHTRLSAREIALESVKIASEMCIYTNGDIIVEELKPGKTRPAPQLKPVSRLNSCGAGREPAVHRWSGAGKESPAVRKRHAKAARGLDEMSPSEIVAELDRYVVGQQEAKKAVAIALRNRIRRQKLDPEMAEEVAPKNIIMIGPTGVGKTEIARRLARLANSPFLKVEATKFTEVGYVGRDVESMVRDLVEMAVDMVRMERITEIDETAESNAEERVLDLLLAGIEPMPAEQSSGSARKDLDIVERSREKLRKQLRAGELDHRILEMEVREHPMSPFAFQVFEGRQHGGDPVQHEGPAQRHDGRQGRRSAACGWTKPWITSSRKRSRSWSTWSRSPGSPWSGSKRTASSFSMRSTRSPGGRAATGRTSAAKACSATSCRSWKAPTSTPATAWCAPTTSCSSPPAHSTSPSRRT